MTDVLGKVRRGIRKPPKIILRRIASEFVAEADRVLAPWQARRLTLDNLVHALAAGNLDELWNRLSARPYFSVVGSVDPLELDRQCPRMRQRIAEAAEYALNHRVNVLGSGPVDIGTPVDWHCDFKTGHRWPPAYFRSIEYNNLDLPSDVKVPWEISRLQWLIPAGQAYLLTGNEAYAECTRDVILNWIEANPYACSVNWTCTMEVALRILSLTWLFHVFHASRAWHDAWFRFRFLATVFMHASFTERHLERADVNGNHFTADAAGLVFAGLFFGPGAAPERWAELGWKILNDELPRQVLRDGVDFEASIAYHRLVQELFLLPALYRIATGQPVPEEYSTRLTAMARFTAAYSRLDGASPLWGDADDGRALPLGTQDVNDHRYLVGLNAVCWKSEELRSSFSGPCDEVFWIFGPEACEWLRARSEWARPRSGAFKESGFFIMRNDRDHIFIDCGPIGLGGRGGHGHNDCLSFEAVLDGIHLITDCGAYLYTASAKDRNLFRSTACHNTPQVDGQEINRFVAWNNLWSLHYDAIPGVRRWVTGADRDVFQGSHLGYRRLKDGVVPIREITLDHAAHALTIRDEFEGSGPHAVEVPLHLAPHVKAEPVAPGRVRLSADTRQFELVWNLTQAWVLDIEDARVSPSYGVVRNSKKLVWRRSGPLVPLEIRICAASNSKEGQFVGC